MLDNARTIVVKLQEKMSLILVISLIAVIALISLFVSVISLSSYTTLEHSYVAQDIAQTAGKIREEAMSLSTIVSDWGPWDDTYEYVQGNQKDFIENNIVPETYQNLRLNLIIIANSRGEVLYAGAYDLRNGKPAAVPADVYTAISQNPTLTDLNNRDGIQGLMLLKDYPVLVASRPVVHSDFSGTPQGVVIMGRYLDQDETGRIARLTQPSLRVIRTDDPGLPGPVLAGLMYGGPDSVETTVTGDGGSVEGYALVRDISGNGAIVLHITEPREIYRQGVTTTLHYIAIVLACGLFFGIVILYLLDRLVLCRVNLLSNRVSALGNQTDITQRVKLGGDDEFSGLATEINRMLDTIEHTQNGLNLSETRFRDLAGLLPQTIFEMDSTGKLLYVNRAGTDIFGITEEKIASGINVSEYLSPPDIGRMHRGLALVLGGAKSSGEIYSLKKKDENYLRAMVHTAPIRRDGRVAGFRGIVVDMSDRLELEEALVESQEYLQSLLWSVQAGILVIDIETRTIIDANPAALAMLDTTKEILISRPCSRFICPSENGLCPASDMNIQLSNTETFLITPGGRKFPVIKYVVPVMLQGKSCLLETFVDNTERKKIEHDLRESTELLTGILQASPVGVFRLDALGKITFVNETFTTITGLSLKEAGGRRWVEILHPDDQEALLRELKSAIDGRRMVRSEARFFHASGSVLWLLGQAVPLVDSAGVLMGWVGTINDITDQKSMETALKESEEKYRALTENSADILFSADMAGTITYISPQVKQYGFAVDDLVNQNMFRFVFPNDRARVANAFREGLARGQMDVAVFRLLDVWGNIHWIEENTSLKHGDDGKPLGIFGVLRDVTERKRDADAVSLANKKLNLMNNITRHDILNTITGLFGLVDMAAASRDEADLAVLHTQIKELGRVIQRQITFTREYQDVGVRAPVWQNVTETVNRALQNFGRDEITFVVEIADTEVYADPLLEKVFYNLVDNAFRYGERVTTIRFHYEISDAGFALICEDDGVGVPGAQKDAIFERGVGRNTGMGLFLTREILLITGITIRESGRPGTGARFEILIPNGMFRFVREKKEG